MILLSQKLVDLIERNADALAKECASRVQQDSDTPHYHAFDLEAIYHRAYKVYKNLGHYLAYETPKEEIAKEYVAMGKERRKEGFALSEIIRAMTLTKRVLWLKVLNDGILDTALELHRALELSARVALFFDRAILYIAIGYEQEAKKSN